MPGLPSTQVRWQVLAALGGALRAADLQDARGPDSLVQAHFRV